MLPIFYQHDNKIITINQAGHSIFGRTGLQRLYFRIKRSTDSSKRVIPHLPKEARYKYLLHTSKPFSHPIYVSLFNLCRNPSNLKIDSFLILNHHKMLRVKGSSYRPGNFGSFDLNAIYEVFSKGKMYHMIWTNFPQL